MIKDATGQQARPMDRLRWPRTMENFPLAGQEAQSEGTNKEGIMLVLSRKHSEQILIGKDITITVVRISPTVVQLGIDAPADINIARGELLDDGKADAA